VVGPDGAPVKGAKVLMAGAHLHPQREEVTDEDGRFWLPQDARGNPDLWFSAPGLSAPVHEGALAPSGEPMVVRLVAAPNAVGQVRSAETGAPVADATVRLFLTWPGVVSRVTRTGPDGRFDLGPVTPGDYMALLEAKGHVAVRGRPVKVGGDSIDFKISKGRALRGRVLDEAGGPVGSATVRPEGDPSLAVTTDAEGRFEIFAAPDGVSFVVAKDGYLRTMTSAAGDAEEALEVVLTRPFRPVEGWVLSPAGGELPGASVQIVAPRGKHNTRTAAGGRFEFHPSFPGPYRVVARHPEYAASEATTIDAQGQVTVSVREAAELAFEVVDADSFDPIPGAEVVASGPERRQARSDGSGQIRFGRLPAGTYQIDAHASWRRPLRLQVTAKPGPANIPARLALPAAGWIKVQVRSADTGTPLNQAWVEAEGARVLTSRGVAVLKGLPIGDVELAVGAEGFQPWRRTVPVVYEETGLEEVFLERNR